MELLFTDSQLQHILESRVRVDDRFGPDDGVVVRQRICELMAAETLAIAAIVPMLDLKRSDDYRDNGNAGSARVPRTSRS